MKTYQHTAIASRLSPVAGMMSTVFGMVRSFQHITHSANAPKFSEVVPFIGEALLLTAALLPVVMFALVWPSRGE